MAAPAKAAQTGVPPASQKPSFSPSSSSLTSPTSSSPGLLSQPSRWLRSYDDFISRNLGQVSQIESALRSLTYIIPGRFRDAEIASETIHTGVQLLSLYHDMLLLRTPSGKAAVSSSAAASRPPGPSPPPPSQHTRYTRYWVEKSPFYRRVAVVLRVVRYTELLCEMAAKRRGERLRWRVVVLIEAIKAICRLLLLRVTRGRTLVRPAMPMRQLPAEAGEGELDDEELDERLDEEDNQDTQDNQLNQLNQHNQNNEAAASLLAAVQPNTISQKQLSPQPPLSPPPSPSPAKATTAVLPHATPLTAPPSPPPSSSSFSAAASQQTKAWTMPRTGMALPPLPQPGDISAYLQGRVLTADDIKAAPRLLNRLRGSGYAAEVLHILAPVVFAAALAHTNIGKKNGSGSRSKFAAWTPWLAGLAMECAARQLRDYDNNGLRTTTLEHDEWTRRGWSMGWWSMRGAFYEHAMKGVVAGVRARVPSFVGSILEDYEYLWENYYFSMSP